MVSVSKNFPHSALFHMKSRVCLKYFVNDCRSCHHHDDVIDVIFISPQHT